MNDAGRGSGRVPLSGHHGTTATRFKASRFQGFKVSTLHDFIAPPLRFNSNAIGSA
jgi:hypothetical protein